MPLAVDFLVNFGEQMLNCNMPDTEDGVSYGNEDEEDMAMIEELPSGVGINLNQRGFIILFSFMICLSLSKLEDLLLVLYGKLIMIILYWL